MTERAFVEASGRPKTRTSARIRRGLIVVAGFVFTGLAAAGAVLPLLPTTPFLLLAAVCFARSSPRMHRWLLANRLFGPYLEEWQRDRTVPKAAKRKAYLLVVLAFGSSIVLVGNAWIRVALLGLGVGVLGFIVWLPTSRGPKDGPQP